MAETKDTTTLRATCLCTCSTLSFTVPTSSLPLATHFCHCSICRRTHGTLCTIHTPIPKPDVNFDTFTSYESSGRATKYFCSTCGGHMLDYAKFLDGNGKWNGEGQWHLATSLIDGPETLWSFHSHFNLESTKDGGLSTWIPSIDRKVLKKWGGSETSDPKHAKTGDYEPPNPLPQTKEGKEKLHAHCHCGGVSFYISRPGADSFTHLPPSLTSRDPRKWYATHDVCTSCRLASGCAIVSWAFPTAECITLSDGSPYTPVFGTAKEYESSKGVKRTFCGRCGAIVTYACDERPKMVDIPVGLLDAESGVRAEEWLEWRSHKLAYEGDVVWKGVIGGLKKGLRSWMEEKVREYNGDFEGSGDEKCA
ncbi:hypothetical protein K469DRAFT_709367 [Zopfia rhizophila CBS 207.26]|uniref:CENP-V/GFA domain-containing protein n=1 Tax=Zopfia rhizophila CBS 207.26 TaxID=1314779 RepID=A0A6A6EUX2_9PEZI|nr:hypothetical protein K469DRAFT_709367 [Zopfia rhizophila CBS 207.26]